MIKSKDRGVLMALAKKKPEPETIEVPLWHEMTPANSGMLSDDGMYLVSYRNSVGEYVLGHRAWWDEELRAFFPMDLGIGFPLRVDAFMKILPVRVK